MLDMGNGISGECSECEERRETEKKLRDREALVWREWMSGNPPYPEARLSTLDTKGREVALEAIRESFIGTRGVWMIGSSGIGKTHILCAIGNYWLSKGKMVSFREYSTFISCYHRDWQLGAKWSEGDNDPPSLLQCTRGDVILLDDVTPTGRVMDLHAAGFRKLLDMISREGKRLYMTGNLDDIQLASCFGGGEEGGRIVSRINGLCAPVRFRGPDRRTEWLQKEQVK